MILPRVDGLTKRLKAGYSNVFRSIDDTSKVATRKTVQSLPPRLPRRRNLKRSIRSRMLLLSHNRRDLRQLCDSSIRDRMETCVYICIRACVHVRKEKKGYIGIQKNEAENSILYTWDCRNPPRPLRDARKRYWEVYFAHSLRTWGLSCYPFSRRRLPVPGSSPEQL